MKLLAFLVLLVVGCSAELASWAAHTKVPVTIKNDTFVAFCLVRGANVSKDNVFQWNNGTNISQRAIVLYQAGRTLNDILAENFTSEFSWTHVANTDETMLSTDLYAQITLPQIKGDEVGVLGCAGEAKLSVPAYAYIALGPGMKASKNVIQGDEYCLKCEAYGWPLPTAIGWYKNGVPLVTDKRVILLDSDNKTANSTLQFNQVEYEDDAEYSCYTSNSLSVSGNATMALRVKDRWAALWPFLGIVAEVIILCAIILLYEKRQQSKLLDDEEEEDMSAAHDGAGYKDEHDGVANGDDVRQRPIIRN